MRGQRLELLGLLRLRGLLGLLIGICLRDLLLVGRLGKLSGWKLLVSRELLLIGPLLGWLLLGWLCLERLLLELLGLLKLLTRLLLKRLVLELLLLKILRLGLLLELHILLRLRLLRGLRLLTLAGSSEGRCGLAKSRRSLTD